MSLRLRLGLWYGALTGLVVIMVALLTYALHTRGHYDDADNVLVGVSQHIADELNHPATGQPPPLGTAPAGVVLRIYDSSGVVVEASSAADQAPSVAPSDILAHPSGPPFDPIVGLVPSLEPIDVGPGTVGIAFDQHGMRWRTYALPLENGGVLVAALPLDRVDASVDRLRQLIPLAAGLGGVTTLLAGLLLAGRALRPVSTLTETAAAIARSRDFERRVEEPSRQDELGRLAGTFNAMLGSLELAYQAQKQFVADASHELRAPLTAIQGNLELLDRHSDMAPTERQEAISEAGREAKRLTQLVADLLSLARADAGVPIRRERVELDRVVLDVVSEARHLAHGQRLTLDAVEPIEIIGDSDRLRQLTLILLDNAIKYTPSTGSVSVSLHRNGRDAMLEVHDTGIGIAQQDWPACSSGSIAPTRRAAATVVAPAWGLRSHAGLRISTGPTFASAVNPALARARSSYSRSPPDVRVFRIPSATVQQAFRSRTDTRPMTQTVSRAPTIMGQQETKPELARVELPVTGLMRAGGPAVECALRTIPGVTQASVMVGHGHDGHVP
jgi:two-component system OmpR family sensor kinase